MFYQSNKIINIESKEEGQLIRLIEGRTDFEARRIKRYLDMPDLTRTPDSPIKEVVERMTGVPDFKDFDIVKVPEVVPTNIAFDLFDFASDHPARSKSDTYFLDNSHILRPH